MNDCTKLHQNKELVLLEEGEVLVYGNPKAAVLPRPTRAAALKVSPEKIRGYGQGLVLIVCKTFEAKYYLSLLILSCIYTILWGLVELLKALYLSSKYNDTPPTEKGNSGHYSHKNESKNITVNVNINA